MKILVVLFFSLCNIICHSNSKDWCDIACEKFDGLKPNIGCQYKGECSAPAKPCKFIEVNRKKLLSAHNHLRYQFASGSEPKAPGIQVSNMMALSWDDDLALLAGCNLMECDSNMKHDACHRTEKFKTSGQNIAWSKGRENCLEYSPTFVQHWYDEIEFLTEGKIKAISNNFEMVPKTGHFTQVIWAETSHVGCAMWSKGSGSSTECMLTCNYGPAGNMITGRMFETGKPASACPNGVKPNNGLCGGDESNKAIHLKAIAFIDLLIVLQFYISN